jgi:hypothetical protein
MPGATDNYPQLTLAKPQWLGLSTGMTFVMY